MNQVPVILIFDIGKTHKKLLLFNEGYELVREEGYQFDQTVDEDGFPCEDVSLLTDWIRECSDRILKDAKYLLKAVNFSAYGASLVYLSQDDQILLTLYNYLKPYLESTKDLFLRNYGPVNLLSQQTASPWLGNLNSGLQLYRIKTEKPLEYDKIKVALHLPQYLSYVLTGKYFSDLTSIGCHTMLWDFQRMQYHRWVKAEGVDKKLAPVKNGDEISGLLNDAIPVGGGVHDSSSALVPYLRSFTEPFVLLSTGTWCISLNPFNDQPLTANELEHDALFYLSYTGKPVKASRIFAGYEHEQQVLRMEDYFDKPTGYYHSVKYDSAIMVEKNRWPHESPFSTSKDSIRQSGFSTRDLGAFTNFETAYHQLISDIIQQQVFSTRLVLPETGISNLFVDGGFSQNKIYMNLLAKAFPALKVYSANIPCASAMGAALAIHSSWNKKQIPGNLLSLKSYSRETIS